MIMTIMIVKKLGPPQQQKLPRGTKEIGKEDLAKSSIAGAAVNILPPCITIGRAPGGHTIFYTINVAKRPSDLLNSLFQSLRTLVDTSRARWV